MEHENLINEFFLLFSKFEYALKMSGFHNGDGNAKADWRGFAGAIENAFNKDSNASLAEGTAYILNNPPNKQVVSNGVLQWSGTPPDSNSEVDLLLQYVCRVRNNLFHGGKYKGKMLDNPDRSEQLITGCQNILTYCLDLSPNVKEAFEGNTT
ncbi:MAG: hypothetical protein ACT6FE_06935 [Methanosarcinaceae archaeon]